MNEPVWVLAAAYLIGAIPFSYLLARWHGVNLRSVGSGNIGATNVARALGPRWGSAALALDASKGALAIALAVGLGLERKWQVWSGASAVLGHVFPVFLGFRGGKGVATAAGAFLALEPRSCLVGLAVFGVAVAVTRYVSLGSILGASAVLGSLVATKGIAHPSSILAVFVWVILVVRHRDNLARLRDGTERRFGADRTDPASLPGEAVPGADATTPRSTPGAP